MFFYIHYYHILNTVWSGAVAPLASPSMLYLSNNEHGAKHCSHIRIKKKEHTSHPTNVASSVKYSRINSRKQFYPLLSLPFTIGKLVRINFYYAYVYNNRQCIALHFVRFSKRFAARYIEYTKTIVYISQKYGLCVWARSGWYENCGSSCFCKQRICRCNSKKYPSFCYLA